MMWKSALFVLSSCIATVLAKKASDYKVISLPGINDTEFTLSQYAGHIEVSPKTHGNIFFWMIEKTHESHPEKLIFWLNGGPGCSSMDGMFLENGPYRVNPDLTLNITTGGWQDYATVVYLDQPVGTGFSYTDSNGYMSNMSQVADEFTVFLDKFFELFPHLKKYDTYLAGESFAGTYIPYFATRMLKRNKKEDAQYNLQGIAIGNGWISPKHQYEAYRDFADVNNLIPGRRNDLIDSAVRRCRRELEEEERININSCERILEYIVEGTVTVKNDIEYCINNYDIRIKDELKSEGCGMSWPHDLKSVKTYLGRADVMNAIHIIKEDMSWSECSEPVYQHLNPDEEVPSYYLLPDIMEEIPVLLFSGDQDLICNVLGTQYLIGNMTWNGAVGFKSAETLNWYIDDKVVGKFTSERNLTFVVIHDGSHMVPYDKPTESLDMINRFIGVGNNRVNGLYSHVGERPIIPAGEADGDEGEETADKWTQYYSWGTSALVVVILITGLFGYCWYRSRKQTREGYRRPSSHNEPMGGGFLGLFGKGKRSTRPKLRLDDQDDTNELDELVIETPLFQADDYSDESQNHQQSHHGNNASPSNGENSKTTTPTRFGIADEDDSEDDFNSFADWDDEEASVAVPSKKDAKASLKKD